MYGDVIAASMSTADRASRPLRLRRSKLSQLGDDGRRNGVERCEAQEKKDIHLAFWASGLIVWISYFYFTDTPIH